MTESRPTQSDSVEFDRKLHLAYRHADQALKNVRVLLNARVATGGPTVYLGEANIKLAEALAELAKEVEGV